MTQRTHDISLAFDYHIQTAGSPLWSFAIHEGHQLDTQLLPYIKLDEQARLREEDPYTAAIADIGVNRLVVQTSRFQLDINRPVADAVYLRPEQAWGLDVWRPTLPGHYIGQLHRQHAAFYQLIGQHLEETIRRFGYFVIFDIHSYNCRRQGPSQEIDQATDPQINLGTYYNPAHWRGLIDDFVQLIRSATLYGRPIDIRENIKFKGGHLAQHLIQRYGHAGCVLSVEFRKDFMDEWTGLPDIQRLSACNRLLYQAVHQLNIRR